MRSPLRLLFAGLAVLFIITVAFAHSNFTGKTLKTITTGCSGSQCHAKLTTSVIVTIGGPDTLVVGQAASFTLKISGGTGTQVACDIAASAGTLAKSDNNMLASAGELTTNGAKTFSAGSYTYNFKYTAPSAPQKVTLYANGLSSHAQFNFAPNKGVVVVNALTAATDAPLAQVDAVQLMPNYPNPVGGGSMVATVPYALNEAATIHLAVYDETGRERAVLAEGRMEPGSYRAHLDAAQLPAGVYFCRLAAQTDAGAVKAQTTRLSVVH